MNSRQVLVVDAGHTRIKFALCQENSPKELPQVVEFVAPMCGSEIPWESIAGWISPEAAACENLITGSNPQAIELVRQNWPAALGSPRLLVDRTQLPLQIQVAEPARVGIDRLLTALAANQLRTPGQMAVIVDTGTAITVDSINSNGAFLGGAILPGVRMGSQALHRYTATLPEIDASLMFDAMPNPIGTCTHAAIESGLYWGHVGSVRELIHQQLEELDGQQEPEPLVLMTGGASPLLKPHFANARFEPYLALQGLAVVALARKRRA